MLDAMDHRSLVARPTQTLTPLDEGPAVSTTQTALSQLTDEVGFGRSEAVALQERYDDLHTRVRANLLAARTQRIKEGGSPLLKELAELGFAWRHVARMVGVSVPAVQKWRRGERMSPESLDKVATLLATCDLVQSSFAVNDVASWFEIPIMPGIPVRPMDLYAAGHTDLILDWVSHHEIDPERLLTRFQPDWRERYSSDFEVFRADDGELALRTQGR